MTPAPALPVAPIVVLVALVGGILAGEAMGPASADAALVAGAGGLLLVMCVRVASVRIALVAVAFALLGVAVMQRALHGLEVSPLGLAVADHADARVVVTLVDDPDSGRYDTRVLVHVDSFDGRPAGGRRVLVSASGEIAEHLRILSAGESAVLRGWCTELEGFDVRWRWKHAVGEVHATEIFGVAHARAPLDRAANGLRGARARRIRAPRAGRPGPARGFPPR